jgi:aminoglycoside phosphotransferase (APT) family kinase protein
MPASAITAFSVVNSPICGGPGPACMTDAMSNDPTLNWYDKNRGVTTPDADASIDPGCLSQWMSSHVEGFSGKPAIRKFNGGQSNPTYLIETANGDYVLRRRPAGALLARAHAVDREFRVLRAMGAAGFVVPRVIALCRDENVIGSAFYVMERVNGRIFWDTRFLDVPREERMKYFNAMNATIAQLHSYDPAALGLGDYGAPGHFVERQINRFARQYEADPDAGRLDLMDRLIEWLRANLPAQDSAAVCHGDFKSDNVIFHPTESRIIAVLDWELSTIGDPVADFAFHAMIYRMDPRVSSGLLGVDLAALAIPTEAQYVESYCTRTGRRSLPNYEYLLAFNFFRLAAIVHGIRGRVNRGTASSRHAKDASSHFDLLVESGWTQARRAEAQN